MSRSHYESSKEKSLMMSHECHERRNASSVDKQILLLSNQRVYVYMEMPRKKEMPHKLLRQAFGTILLK